MTCKRAQMNIALKYFPVDWKIILDSAKAEFTAEFHSSPVSTPQHCSSTHALWCVDAQSTIVPTHTHINDEPRKLY